MMRRSRFRMSEAGSGLGTISQTLVSHMQSTPPVGQAPPQPQSVSTKPSSTGAPSSIGGLGGSSPSHTQLHRITGRDRTKEFSPYDPLGGMVHKDYIRDNSGVPHFAPRNIADGGRFSFGNVKTPLVGALSSSPARSIDVAHIQAESRRMRELARSGVEIQPDPSMKTQSSTQVEGFPSTEAFFNHSVMRGGVHETPKTSWIKNTDPSVSAPQNVVTLNRFDTDRERELQNIKDRRLMYQLHGFDEYERNERKNKEKYEFQMFTGYDKEHSEIAKAGKYYNQAERSAPLTPPSTFNEAVQNVSSGSLSSTDEHRRKLIQDGQHEKPMFGEDLTQHVVKGMQAHEEHERDSFDSQRADEFGIGRQGPLVQDGGPDQRKFRMHKNDERYLTGMDYYLNAYEGFEKEISSDPYIARQGLTNMFKSSFDSQRRNYNVANDKPDVFDQTSIYLGVPLKTQIDDRVRGRKNARGERPLEYFMPFPNRQDLQLTQIYEDVQGMLQISRGKGTKEEWGLFLRYREHWYQRRQIALLHNLEPKRGENITERDERRAKLDKICAATLFVEPTRKDLDIPSADALRSWFGAVLPSTTDKDKAPDTEGAPEFVLSIQFLKDRLILTGNQDLSRSHASQTALKMPPLTLKYEMTQEKLSMLSAEQRNLYEEYVKSEIKAHNDKWTKILQQRKYIPSLKSFVSRNTSVTDIEADGVVSVITDDGTKAQITVTEWNQSPLEVTPEDPNLHLNWGASSKLYQKANYIEVQDYLWEERVYKGIEGWSPAVHTDNLKPKMIVMAQRQLGHTLRGSWEKAEVVQYDIEPYYNPATSRRITVRFVGTGETQTIPLSSAMIWQLHWSHPDRTVPQETRRHTGGFRRYIDMRDPKGDIKKATKRHFLDDLIPPDTHHPFQTIKQITELDNWYRWDNNRADNYRRLTVNDRKEYIVANYYHKYTPWDLIAHQENDQPLMFFDYNYIRDNVGPSYFTNRNRFWTHKRRATGYIRNFPEEIRDYFSHIDQKVPWAKAKHVQRVWRTRQHNPIAYFHSSPLAGHRNTIAALPSSTWEVDRKTGKITGLKDDINSYIAMNKNALEN